MSSAPIDRRRLLRLGGQTLAWGAVAAAIWLTGRKARAPAQAQPCSNAGRCGPCPLARRCTRPEARLARGARP